MSFQKTHPTLPYVLAFTGPLLYFVFLSHAELVWLAGTLVALFLFDSLGVQVGVHKLLSHRAFKTHRWIRTSLAFLSLFSGQGSPIFWVAVHMGSHHPHADSERDVHGPHHGRIFAFLTWYWKVDAKKISFLPVREYLSDRKLIFFHKHHYLMLLAYWGALLVIGFATPAGLKPLVYLGLLPVALSLTLVGLVNTFLHSSDPITDRLLLKYKNHSSQESSNSVILGLLTMGLGLHNNHHHAPQAVTYGERWFEVDPSRWIIAMLATDADPRPRQRRH